MLNTETLALDAATLAASLAGDVVAPGDKEYDLARRAWNLAVDQRPALVAFPVDAADVMAVVDFARARGLRVAPQGTGHNAGAAAAARRRHPPQHPAHARRRRSTRTPASRASPPARCGSR